MNDSYPEAVNPIAPSGSVRPALPLLITGVVATLLGLVIGLVPRGRDDAPLGSACGSVLNPGDVIDARVNACEFALAGPHLWTSILFFAGILCLVAGSVVYAFRHRL